MDPPSERDPKAESTKESRMRSRNAQEPSAIKALPPVGVESRRLRNMWERPAGKRRDSNAVRMCPRPLRSAATDQRGPRVSARAEGIHSERAGPPDDFARRWW